MIMEKPLSATFRHYDEWNGKNQGQKIRVRHWGPKGRIIFIMPPLAPFTKVEGGWMFHVLWAAKSVTGNGLVIWRLPKKSIVPNVF